MSENIKVTFDTAEEDLHVNLDAGAIMYGKLKVGTTTTGDAGTSAKVENVGTNVNAILNFTIPKGDRGEQGIQGIQGERGLDGLGVPAGGTTGQVLAKKSGTDNDTEWIDCNIEVKDIPANTNVDEFFEEGTYAWNGDDGKAITGLPNDIVDMPSFSYMLKITKHSTMTNEKNKFEHYFQEFWLEGMFIYTRKITVRTGLETGKISYERYSWERQALVNYDGVTVSSTEPTNETEKAKVWIQKGKNLFNKNGTTIVDEYIDGGTGEIKAYTNGTKMFILEVLPNTTYTISKTQGGHFRVGTTNNYPSVGTIVDGMKNNGSATSITITTNSTAKYLCCSYWQTGVDTITEESMRESIQVERGLSATAYEEAITSAIYTKESNNKYEKFTETVAISSHQPINQNGLWLQKGKNLLNPTISYLGDYTYNNGVYTLTSGSHIYLMCENLIVGKPYTVSYKNLNGFNQVRVNDYNYGNSFIEYGRNTETSGTITFIATTSTAIVAFLSGSAGSTIEDVQLELGSTTTNYEEYVDKKIYTKNNNVYEEFINADEVKNDYSLGERRIGTWIDGKPLYRKVLVFPNGTEIVTDTGGRLYNLSDFGINNVEEIHFVHPSYYNYGGANIPFPFYDGNTYNIQVYPTQLRIICTYEGIAVRRMVITLQYTKTTDVATTSEE